MLFPNPFLSLSLLSSHKTSDVRWSLMEGNRFSSPFASLVISWFSFFFLFYYYLLLFSLLGMSSCFLLNSFSWGFFLFLFILLSLVCPSFLSLILFYPPSLQHTPLDLLDVISRLHSWRLPCLSNIRRSCCLERVFMSIKQCFCIEHKKRRTSFHRFHQNFLSNW